MTAEQPVGPRVQPGKLLARRYRIERLLGRGATGAVWAALDEDVGDRVALKLLTAGPADAAERFRREVRLARRVTHRNAARIFDLGAADGLLYLTMELIEGESLHELLRRDAPLTVGRAAEIGVQIASGLAAAHEVGVVHRDIKPANVLIEPGGRVVLTDFGLARAVQSDAQVTQGTPMLGTPYYMAPEQVRGEAVGPATDLYALGCMLFEMLTGTCPFVRDTAVSTALARLEDDPPDPRRLSPLPDDVAARVLACLERAPDRRPESATAVAATLETMRQQHASGAAAAATLLDTSSRTVQTSQTGQTGAAGSSGSGAASSWSRTGSPGSTFFTLAPQDRTLAVLPFRHRGPAEHSYVAESIGEDLVDVLTTTRGLRVTSSGASAKYQGQSVDPREAGRELGVDAIVDGTVRVTGQGLRISARLIDVATGEQLWVDRFEGSLDDTEIHDIVAQRIAESLRVELEVLGARHRMPEAAFELYVAACQQAAVASLTDDGLTVALELLERSLAVAPDFDLALAKQAEICVRRWFLPSEEPDGEVAARAHQSVARALEKASHLALTHYAAGRLAVSDGRFGDAARELSIALAMAPTYAVVHDYLGSLQCEAGRADEGERHLVLARKLDPSLPVGALLARRRALERDLDSYHAMVAEMRAAPSVSRFMIESLELRVGGWFGDLETVRRCRPEALVNPDHPAARFFAAQRAAVLGEGTAAELGDSLEAFLATGGGPRLDAFMRQLACEALSALGEHDAAFEQLRRAVSAPVFVDTDWMERCPALDPLRDRAEMSALSGEVRRRADAIWRVRTG